MPAIKYFKVDQPASSDSMGSLLITRPTATVTLVKWVDNGFPMPVFGPQYVEITVAEYQAKGGQ